MVNRKKILEQGTKYANENWNVNENPNEHDNAHDDFIAGAQWAVADQLEALKTERDELRITLNDVKSKLEKVTAQRNILREDSKNVLASCRKYETERDELKAENERLKEGVRNLKWFAFSAITSVGVANLSNYKEHAEKAKMFIADKIAELLKEKP